MADFENTPQWLRDLTVRVHSLIRRPEVLAQFQDMLRVWFNERRIPIDVLPIPDRRLTLPEKYAILAAVYDEGWKGEKINPWPDPISEKNRAEADALINDGKKEEAVGLLEEALGENGIGALKDGMPYAVLLGKVQDVPEIDVPFIENILADVEQDLVQLAAQHADGTASGFPDYWDPDWDDPPQNPDEAARLLYEALDDWGQTSWSDRHFVEPLEPGNDVYNCVCALERLMTPEERKPRLPHLAGTYWPQMVALSRMHDRTESDSLRLVELRGKMLDWLRERFPNAVAVATSPAISKERPKVSTVSEWMKAIREGHRVHRIDPSHLDAWELLLLRIRKRFGKVTEEAVGILSGEVGEANDMRLSKVNRLTLSEFWGLVESKRAEPPKVEDTDQQDERTEAEGGRKPKSDGLEPPAENWWFDSPPSEGSEFDGNGPVKSTLKKMAEWLNEDPRIVKGHNGKSLCIQKLHARQYAFWFASKKQYAEVNQKSIAESARNSAK